ncbi:MAG: maleylpyruvate isomerase N-terminal domain-containing protein, partial [Streptosporangiaceae bacterium]
MTENMDPRPLYRRAVAQTETIVAAVTPDQFILPTPCTEYDVRALLAHIVGGLTRTALVGEGD